MRRLLARLSSALLALLVFPDVGHCSSGSAIEFCVGTFEDWRRSHYFGFTSRFPRQYIVFLKDGRNVVMTPSPGPTMSVVELRSCTPWGILREVRDARLALEVMES